MRTRRADDSLVVELLKKRIGVGVARNVGEPVEIDIFPTTLSPEKLRALVRWRGADIESSLVLSAGVDSRLGQILALTYLATRPTACPKAKDILDGWSALSLTFADPWSLGADTVRVELHRADWIASTAFSKDCRLDDDAPLPTEFRSYDPGAALVEAASHLLLSLRFLARDAVRNCGGATWLVLDPRQHGQ